MKIIKSKIFKRRKCEFGNFEIVPEKGWKISQSFIDFESGLLIVSESDEDKNNWRSGGGISQIPNRQFIIDQKNAVILKPTEWIKYFNYKTIETYSEDKKLKLLSTRVHEPERNTDGIKEELIDVESGKTISTSTGVAFRKEIKKTLIDSHYESIASAKRYRQHLELGEYPENLKAEHYQNLKEKDIIIEYYDNNSVYKLAFEKDKLVLGKTFKPKSIEEWNNYEVEKIVSFIKISEFWDYLSKEKKWFKNLNPRQIHPSLHFYIINYHNKTLSHCELTYNEHKALQEWMNQCWDKSLNRNVYWQFCSNCKERVLYGPRYPKHACRNCVNLIKDENGNELDYRNTHELKYINSEFQVLLKDSNTQVKLFIKSNEYWASEARFGGIVHQKKEN